MISDVNIAIDRDLCIACGNCVDRCIVDNLRLSVAPCRQACPLNLNCQGYVRLIAQGKEGEAAEEVRKYTPFAGILGAVCARPCESACERGKSVGDGAVNIRALKRYLAKKFPEIVDTPPEVTQETDFKVCVVGSGPAGLAAAFELRQAGHDVTVYEANDEPGGFLLQAIPAFRLEKAEVKRSCAMLAKMGVTFKTGKRLGKDITIQDLEEKYQAVVLAIGASKPAVLNIKGEDLPNVKSGLDILAQARNGVAENLEGKEVVVIGGGNTALDSAVTCMRLGAKQVRMVSLEGPDEMPAHNEELSLAVKEGLKVDNCLSLLKIKKDGERLSLSFGRCLKVFDNQGAFAPKVVDDFPMTRSCDMVVVSVGQKISENVLPAQVIGESVSWLQAEPVTQKISTLEKTFVAGDCTTGPSSVVGAMASGKEAAISVNRMLAGLDLTYERDFYLTHGMEKEYVALPQRAKGGARLDLAEPKANNLNQIEEKDLTDEQAKAEAERCLSCGRPFERNRTCWYCLPCEVDCPAEALNVRMPYQVR